MKEKSMYKQGPLCTMKLSYWKWFDNCIVFTWNY